MHEPTGSNSPNPIQIIGSIQEAVIMSTLMPEKISSHVVVDRYTDIVAPARDSVLKNGDSIVVYPQMAGG